MYDQMKSKIISQYSNNTNMLKLLKIFADELSLVNEINEQLLNGRLLENNIGGKNLDILGKIVGINRLDLSDEYYLMLIKLKILINTAILKVENYYDFFKSLDNIQFARYILLENLKPRFDIKVNGFLTDVELFAIEKIPHPLGIHINMWQEYNEDSFSFAEDEEGKGFCVNQDDNYGGRFAKPIGNR